MISERKILILKTGNTIKSLLDTGKDFEHWFTDYSGLCKTNFMVRSLHLEEPLVDLRRVAGIIITGSPAYVTDKEAILEERHRDRDEVETIQNYFGEQLEENRERFDSAVYVNVLEHVERDREEVGIAHQALKPGGHLAILVPALEWLYSEFDSQLGHFRRYRKDSLVSLLENRGFEIQEAKYFDMAGIMPWYLMMVMFNKTLNSGNVSAYDKLVIPITRFLEGKWAPAIGKNLLVVGRKVN